MSLEGAYYNLWLDVIDRSVMDLKYLNLSPDPRIIAGVGVMPGTSSNAFLMDGITAYEFLSKLGIKQDECREYRMDYLLALIRLKAYKRNTYTHYKPRSTSKKGR